MSTEALDKLQEATSQARLRMQNAADCLAYDVTFRATVPNPVDGRHQKASPALTAALKAEYVFAVTAFDEAVKASRDAFAEWDKANGS